jgi:hypothetical protein
MAWIRIDDNEAEHPKVLALIQAAGYEAYYRLARLRCYCARQKSGGRFDRAAARELRVRPAILEALISVELVDVLDDGTFQIHDWPIYNGETVAQRVEAYLASVPDASANEVARAVGGKKADVLAEIERIRGGSRAVPNRFPGGSQAVPERFPAGSESVPSRARARSPSQERDISLPELQDLGDVPSRRRGQSGSRRGEGWVENLSAYTGCRYVRGEHAASAVYDPLGTEQPPRDWPHPRPTRAEIVEALRKRAEEREQVSA